MKSNIPEQMTIPKMPNLEAMMKEYCLCTSCKNEDICKYRSCFVDYQWQHFPAKIDCYKYERNEENANH